MPEKLLYKQSIYYLLECNSTDCYSHYTNIGNNNEEEEHNNSYAILGVLYIILNSQNDPMYYPPHITDEETMFLGKLNYNMPGLTHIVKYWL